MSLETVARPRPVPPVAGFGSVLRAEWTKFRTVRGWVIGMIVAAVVMDLFGLILVQQHVGCAVSGHPSGAGGPAKAPACVVPKPVVTLGPGGEPVTDSYTLAGQPMGVNGSLTVRVTSLTGRYGGGGPGSPLSGLSRGVQPWSKAGIIVTASTRQGAAYAAIMATGSHGVAMQYDYTSSVAGMPGDVSAASPRWLRLVRAGDTITGYDSADGTHWTQVGTATLAGLASTVRAGMFATSPQWVQFSSNGGGGQTSPSLATGVFDHVRLTGGTGPAGGTWTGDDVGGNGLPFGQLETFHQAAGRFTVTGSGDIAPDVNGPGGVGPASTFSFHLAGVLVGLIAVAVVAVMFMTAEYRRGLIRVTLAASPRRGQVLAAKAIVAALSAFASVLVASVIVVPIGLHIDHQNGLYVFPVSWLTAVRVVGGTAALLAVAAVLAVAIAALTRRSVVAVTAVIVGIVVPWFLGLAPVLPASAAGWLLRVTPAAGFSIQQSMTQYPQVTNQYTAQNGYFPLGPWGGFAVMCGYAAVALGLALLALRRRDA
jgi:ABC-type transport system involved in multi-copper enzyme maturation permease subunit